jgi:hypothetical protein
MMPVAGMMLSRAGATLDARSGQRKAARVNRHDFDSLPITSKMEVRPARQSEISALADMACRMVPGVEITGPILTEYFKFDPECILTFNQRGRLLGAMAFLYLNNVGHDALVRDEISLTRPDVDLLAGSGQEVSAIYIWAIAALGRGIAGLGNAAAHLRTARYVSADCFAQPSTVAGRDLLIATGFRQIPSLQPDLWRYERLWKKLPPNKSPSIVPGRSFAYARS